jgi:hypothetical protein
VLVVVVVVTRVSAAVVDVVDMVAMRNRHVATAIAVHMVVLRMHLMLARRLAFVVVIVVPSMEVTVVHIVDVITVRDGDMSAAFAVDVRVTDVFAVNCLSHRFLTAVSTRLRLLSVLARPPYDTTGRGHKRKRLMTQRCRGCAVCATESPIAPLA